jgi:hypothetical protein
MLYLDYEKKELPVFCMMRFYLSATWTTDTVDWSRYCIWNLKNYYNGISWEGVLLTVTRNPFEKACISRQLMQILMPDKFLVAYKNAYALSEYSSVGLK